MSGHRKPSIYKSFCEFHKFSHEQIINKSLANSTFFFYTNSFLGDQLQNLTHVCDPRIKSWYATNHNHGGMVACKWVGPIVCRRYRHSQSMALLKKIAAPRAHSIVLSIPAPYPWRYCGNSRAARSMSMVLLQKVAARCANSIILSILQCVIANNPRHREFVVSCIHMHLYY